MKLSKKNPNKKLIYKIYIKISIKNAIMIKAL